MSLERENESESPPLALEAGLDRIARAWPTLQRTYRLAIRPLSERQLAWLRRTRATASEYLDLEQLEAVDRRNVERILEWNGRMGSPSKLLLMMVRAYDEASTQALREELDP